MSAQLLEVMWICIENLILIFLFWSGKEERKKLYGFDCPECQEYYQQKLEEGLTKVLLYFVSIIFSPMCVHSQDQILMLMNKCSKHRGLFKPPLTPERFWDADILEVEYKYFRKNKSK